MANEDADTTFEGGDGSVMIDMQSVEDVKNEIVPRGTYPAVIADCEFKHSQNSGQPMWAYQLEITEGEYQGRKLFGNMSFSPKALPYTKKTLGQIAPELLSGPFNPEDEAANMQGKAVRVKTKIGKNLEGEERTEVADLLSGGGADDFMNG